MATRPPRKAARMHASVRHIPIPEPTQTLGLPHVRHVSYKEKDKDYILPAERHTGLELCFVDRGALYAHISGGRGKPIDLYAFSGTLMCWLENDAHSLYAAPGDAPNLVTIHASGPLPKGMRRLSRKLLPLTTDERQLIKKMLEENATLDSYTALRQSLFLLDLLISLLRRVSNSGPNEGPTQKHRSLRPKPSSPGANVIVLQNLLVKEARKEIERRLEKNEELSVSALARALCVSSSHLSHTFSAVGGTSVMAHVRKQRMKRAQILLRESPLSISEIALKCGFASIHPFSRAFKKESGFSPSSYAKSVRPK